MSDLAGRVIANVRCQIFAQHQSPQCVNHVAHRARFRRSEIESLAADVGSIQRFGKAHIRRYRVLHVDVVASGSAIGPQHRPLPEMQAANCPRHHPAPVQIAAAIDIAAARHRHGQAVGFVIRPRDQIGTGFRDIVRKAALGRHRFGVRQLGALSISFVAGRHDHLLYVVPLPAARFENVIGAANVGFEGRERTASCGSHDGLRRQMKHGADLVFHQGTLDRCVILDRAVHDAGAIEHSAANQFTLRVPVAHQHCDIGTKVHELAHQPRPHQTRAAGHEDAPVSPEFAHAHTLHGASPELHNFSSSIFSRTVSMGCQKPSW